MSHFSTAEQLEWLRAVAEVGGITGADVSLPIDRFVELNGIRFHYLDWGGDGVPMVFLHGGALTAHTFDGVCLALRDRYRCLSLDLRGHGDTEWPPEVDDTLDASAADLGAFIDALALERPVVVGMSRGGLNGLTYAVSHSDRIRALVMIDIAPEIQVEGTSRIVEFSKGPEVTDSPEDFVAHAIEFNARRDPRVVRGTILFNLRRLEDGRWTWKYDRRPQTAPTSANRWERYARLWDELRSVTCPTLIVKGGRSRILTEAVAERLASGLPNGRWITIPDAGHAIQVDQPKALAEAIDRFVAERAP
jgi:esterase